jgi:hypothetical protein
VLGWTSGEYKRRQSEPGAENGDGGARLDGMKFLDNERGVDKAFRRAAEGSRDLAFDQASFDSGLVDRKGGSEALVLGRELGIEGWCCREDGLREGLGVGTECFLCRCEREADHDDAFFLGIVRLSARKEGRMYEPVSYSNRVKTCTDLDSSVVDLQSACSSCYVSMPNQRRITAKWDKNIFPK